MKYSAIFILFLLAVTIASSCRKSSGNSAGVIRSISPVSGHFGTMLTIKGTGFRPNSYVIIDGISAQMDKITDTLINVTVPTTHSGPVVVSDSGGEATTTGPTFTYVDDILLAGMLTLSSSPYVYSYPFYWDNGTPFLLKAAWQGPSGAATGITAIGNDIYVCGYQYYGPKRYANVWKNGMEQPLSNTISQDAAAYAIQVAGQHVYTAGYLNNGNLDVATIWVDGQPVSLLGDTVDSYANSLTVVGNDVYVAGYRSQSNSNNHIALYWKNGSATSLSDGTRDALTTGIAIVGTDVYISGNMAGGVLWKNGVVQSLNYSSAGLCSSNSGIYLAGQTNGIYGISGIVWALPPGNAAYNVTGVTVNAVTADSAGVYTANSTSANFTTVPSYSICTDANSVTTVPAGTYTPQGFGSATAICVRR